ncbi:hypothetical protein AMTRI_Chr13g90110 [Amborella trichopoda]
MGIKAVIVLFLVFSFCFDLTKATPNTRMQTEHGTTMKVEEGLRLGPKFATKFWPSKWEPNLAANLGKTIAEFSANLEEAASADGGHAHHPSRRSSFERAIFGVLSIWVFFV